MALVDAYGYAAAESDLAKYRETYGLEPCTTANGCFKRVNQKGEEKNYPKEGELLEADWQLESALDLDMVSAACPHCHITLVEATTQEPKDTAASAEEAAKLGATEISNSYGYPENNETYCPAKKGCAEYLADYKHAGIPVTVSSGDSGYDDGVGAPSWPATSPNVIAVGGTSLRREKSSRGWAESVWSGSGSGCSLYEAKPTWQTDTGCTKRTDNDVAAVANNETPVSVYEGRWIDVGGTSVSSPLIAAIEAHANSATRSAGAEAFYKKPGMLFDITSGGNGACTPPAEDEYLCAAKSGYDGPTGWGTPNGVFHLNGWVGQAITNLSAETNTKTNSLASVSCPAAESCYAVGHYLNKAGVETALAEHWNGTAWSIEETPEAYAKSALTGIWCDETTSCNAVGHAINASGTEITLAERWNGVAWSIREVPNPTGAKSASLSGVACTAGEFGEECTAVGHYVNSSGTEVALAEHSLGGEGRWTIQETAIPTGATHSSLSGVSCNVLGGQSCMAVGHYVNSTGAEVTLAELRAGTSAKWTVSETPNPTGAKSGSLSGVSCPAGCSAVGHYVNSSGVEVTLAEHWVLLGAWSIVESPNPTGAKSSSLLGVSCRGTTEETCEAVGHYVNSSSVEVTLGEALSAKVWSVQETPNPSGAKNSGLAGVSCSGTEACTAAGSYVNGSESAFAERWSTTKKWALQETAIPQEPSGSLAVVSCTTISACTAVGHRLNSGGTEVTLAERWNGKEWTLQETPNPTGAKGSGLIGVSCKSSTSCIGVGRYINSSGVETALGESWNGTTWTLKEPIVPTGAKSSKLVSVSCITTTSCIAVGAYVNSSGTQVTLGESWNGTAWTLKEPLNPTGATSGSLSGVSCASSTSCIATGRYVNSSGVEVTLAESWSGTAWTLKEPLNPTGAKSSILIGVSCTSSTSCVGVGDYVNSGGVEVTLAESWNGTAWTIQETPNPEATSNRLVGVSCTSSSACIATGFSIGGSGLEEALAEEDS
ncbi:MAG: hypothetical protein WAU77_03510 [Solirubrobacteraceae bacterium]